MLIISYIENESEIKYNADNEENTIASSRAL